MVSQYLHNAFPTPNEVEANGPLCPVHYSSLSANGAYKDNVDGTYCN